MSVTQERFEKTYFSYPMMNNAIVTSPATNITLNRKVFGHDVANLKTETYWNAFHPIDIRMGDFHSLEANL